jgi:O-antigen/teichoic acid export membrane protein
VPQVAVRGVTERTSRRLRMEAALVSIALLGANALSYLLNMVAARALAQDVYGALGSLLALVVVGAVPAMGMQTVAALHVARAIPGRSTVDVERQLIRTGLGGAAVVGTLAILAAPLLMVLLHLPSGWSVVWLGLALAPLTLLGVFHGVLQGHRRFAMLALLVGVEGTTKVGGALAGLLAFGGITATLAGMAAGSALAAAVGWWLCGRRRPRRAAAGSPRLAGEVLHASQAILGLVLLVNLDIVLARHNLTGAEAGDYAVGAVITKIAYWLPQAVAVIVLPRFVDERHRRRTVPLALVVIVLLDVWVVLLTVRYGPQIIRLIGCPGYGSHVTAAWLFAVLGSLLALVQLLLYSRIASADRRSATAVWAAVVAETVLVTFWLDGSVTEVACAALVSVALLVLAGLAIEYCSARRPLDAPLREPLDG